MELQLELLLMSYTLEEILNNIDVTEEYVLSLLVEKGLLNLGDYFEESTDA